jgi:hypothetical protein
MRCTLLLPGSLLPASVAADVLAELKAPALTARLARTGSVVEHAVSEFAHGAAHLDWIARRFFGAPLQAALPTAPYAFAALTDAAPAGQSDVQYWHADPVHWSIARDHALLLPLDAAPLAQDEEDQLFAAAADVCNAHDCMLVRGGSHWFLRPREAWSVAAQPLDAVAYEPIEPRRYGGAHARRWSRLQNEIQMVWHEHRVNEDRGARGLPAANSLWLHGGGTWRALPPAPFVRIRCTSPALRGIALAAGVKGDAHASPGDGDLTVWDDAFIALRRGDWRDWRAAIEAIDRRIESLPRDATLEIVLAGKSLVREATSGGADRWRIWRRRAVAALLVEGAP